MIKLKFKYETYVEKDKHEVGPDNVVIKPIYLENTIFVSEHDTIVLSEVSDGRCGNSNCCYGMRMHSLAIKTVVSLYGRYQYPISYEALTSIEEFEKQIESGTVM